MREEFPQGLKPGFIGLKMSELKLRPPKTIYAMASSSVKTKFAKTKFVSAQ
jgi:hypothetical protein